MITLYLDTSSLVKLYIEENGSEEVRQDLSEATTGATSAVTYAEARAAFARMRRDGTITAAVFQAAKRDLDSDWSQYLVIEPTIPLCRTAGDLAEEYRLRGFDSIHLATFLQLANDVRPSEARFLSFDRELNRAAVTAHRRLTRSLG